MRQLDSDAVNYDLALETLSWILGEAGMRGMEWEVQAGWVISDGGGEKQYIPLVMAIRESSDGGRFCSQDWLGCICCSCKHVSMWRIKSD